MTQEDKMWVSVPKSKTWTVVTIHEGKIWFGQGSGRWEATNAWKKAIQECYKAAADEKAALIKKEIQDLRKQKEMVKKSRIELIRLELQEALAAKAMHKGDFSKLSENQAAQFRSKDAYDAQLAEYTELKNEINALRGTKLNENR